jgi:hypothetical protein
MNALLYGWPWVALVCGVGGLLVLFGLPRPPSAPSRFRDPAFFACLMLPIYMVHQFEEHGVDLLGRHYHFIDEICAMVARGAGDCPADPPFILAVNCGGGVWIPGLLAIAYRRRRPLVGACALGIPLVNAVAHIGQALVLGRYNSGVVTAALLFVPVCAWALVALRKLGVLSGLRILRVVATGGVLHALLIASLLAKRSGLIGEEALLAINLAYGPLPLLLGSVATR